MRIARAAVLAALLATAVSGVAPASADAARGINLGLTDSLFSNPDETTREHWLGRAESVRAAVVMVHAGWRGIAPGSRPNGFDPTDPADPSYSWDRLDGAVRDARERGFRVLMLVAGGAPDWAEGPHRPSRAKARAGTWMPRPLPLRDFAKAVAKRYSGRFDPDGAGPEPALPRVRDFQLWAEPNLSTYLNPQWHNDRPISPTHYRRMLRGFYAGIKRVDRRSRVATGGTAPYGDPFTYGSRIQPALFWRRALCLRDRDLLQPAPCDDPAYFDVLAHHPINVGAPRREAINSDDVSTPDIGKLRRILRKAERTGRARGAKRHPIWATELWWDSDPPDPDGVPERRHARWIAESFYLLWRQGVRLAVWFQIRDPAGSNHPGLFETGLFFNDGESKLAARAFRFPFVGDRANRRKVWAWGKAPSPGPVLVQARRRGGWHAVGRTRAGRNGVFVTGVRLRGKAWLRARTTGQMSLPWRQR